MLGCCSSFSNEISRMAVLCCEYSTSGHRQSPSEATSLLLKHILRIHAMKLGPSSDEADVHPLTTSKLASFHRQQLSSWQSMAPRRRFPTCISSPPSCAGRGGQLRACAAAAPCCARARSRALAAPTCPRPSVVQRVLRIQALQEGSRRLCLACVI